MRSCLRIMASVFSFHIYTSKPIEKADMTARLKLRTVPIYRPFFEKLGATNAETQHAELYTALERGVVDGYGWSLWGLKEQGFLPVTKFRSSPASIPATYRSSSI